MSLIDMGLRMNSFSVLGLRMRFISVSKHTGRSLVHAVFKLVLRMSFISVFVLECVPVVLEIENHYIIKNSSKHGYIYLSEVNMIVTTVAKHYAEVKENNTEFNSTQKSKIT